MQMVKFDYVFLSLDFFHKICYTHTQIYTIIHKQHNLHNSTHSLELVSTSIVYSKLFIMTETYYYLDWYIMAIV